eukprot:363882_1
MSIESSIDNHTEEVKNTTDTGDKHESQNEQETKPIIVTNTTDTGDEHESQNEQETKPIIVTNTTDTGDEHENQNEQQQKSIQISFNDQLKVSERKESPNILSLDKNNFMNAKENTCNGILKCFQLQRLMAIMIQYNPNAFNQKQFDTLNIQQVVDDFLHAIHYHNKDIQFEYIVEQLGDCNILKCSAFNRNNRNRSIQQVRNDKNETTSTDFKLQILDKIHCHFQHSYDIGYRLSSKQKEITENKSNDHDYFSLKNGSKNKMHKLLVHNRQNYLFERTHKKYYIDRLFVTHNNTKITKQSDSKYCFGYVFFYHNSEDNIYGNNLIQVSKKYSTKKK